MHRSGKTMESDSSGFGSIFDIDESPLMKQNTMRRSNIGMKAPRGLYGADGPQQLSSDEMDTVMRKLTEFETM